MITLGKIENSAIKYQTNDQNIVNEYFQHLFLSNFYQNKNAKNIFFKGGTALRLVYNSPRYSEDLDFSSGKLRGSQIEKILLETFVVIEKEGIEIKLIEAKETTGGYLGIIKLKDDKYSSRLKLEISFRDKKAVGEAIYIQSEFMPQYIIFALNRKVIVSEKIQALLTRQKPRDFYDLYFILRSNLMTSDQKNLLSEAKLKILDSKLDFSKELKTFLPRSHWPIIKDLKKNLIFEIGKFIHS